MGKIIEKNLNSGLMKGIKKVNSLINFDLEEVKFLILVFLATILKV